MAITRVARGAIAGADEFLLVLTTLIALVRRAAGLGFLPAGLALEVLGLHLRRRNVLDLHGLEAAEGSLAGGSERTETLEPAGDLEELLDLVLADLVLVEVERDGEPPLLELRPTQADRDAAVETTATLVDDPLRLLVLLGARDDQVLLEDVHESRKLGRVRRRDVGLALVGHRPTRTDESSEEHRARQGNTAPAVTIDLLGAHFGVRQILLDLRPDAGGEARQGLLGHRVHHQGLVAHTLDSQTTHGDAPVPWLC